MITERWEALEKAREEIIKQEEEALNYYSKLANESVSKKEFVLWLDKCSEAKGLYKGLKEAHRIINELILEEINKGQEELNKMEDSL